MIEYKVLVSQAKNVCLREGFTTGTCYTWIQSATSEKLNKLYCDGPMDCFQLKFCFDISNKNNMCFKGLDLISKGFSEKVINKICASLSAFTSKFLTEEITQGGKIVSFEVNYVRRVDSKGTR